MLIGTADKVRGGQKLTGTRFGRTVKAPWGVDPDHPRTVQMAPESDYIPLGVTLSFVSPPDKGWGAYVDQIQRIRDEFDPSFTPIARYHRFRNRSTKSERTFLHLGFCRYDPNAQPDQAVLNAVKPQSGRMARWLDEFRPNVVGRWFENPAHVRPGSKRALNNLPPPFIPWGSWVFGWARETFWEASAREKRELMKKQDEERAKERETETNEAGYRLKHDASWLQRLQDKLGADDYREYVARMNGTYEEPKTPFVQVKAQEVPQ